MRKPIFYICENKGSDQLRSNSTADQRLCFRYIDSTIPLLPKSKISSLLPSSVAAQLGFCRSCSETPKTGSIKRERERERERLKPETGSKLYPRC